MNDLFSHTRQSRVALLVDGDNLSHTHAGAIIVKSAKYGTLTVKRVYCNVATHPGWGEAPGFKTVHSGTGKNATDILLAVEAMALILQSHADVLAIASSDGDFTHLVQHLTERGTKVIGLGEAKAPAKFRKSCSQFHEVGGVAPILTKSLEASPALPRPIQPITDHIQQIRTLVAAEAQGIAITLLSTRMAKDNAFQVSQSDFKSWRSLLTSFPDHFVCDPVGPAAKVRLKA